MNNSLREHYVFTMPRGLGALLLLQMCSIITFCVLFSILRNYAAYFFQFTAPHATALVGSFLTLTLATHVAGGYLGGRYFNYRTLLAIGTSFSLLGCALLAWPSLNALYWGLSLVILGSGVSLTCVNCLITQLFKPEDQRRETAFLWNYAGMNLGFLIAFIASHSLKMALNDQWLLIACVIVNALTLLLLFSSWRRLNDRSTHSLSLTKLKLRKMMGIGLLLLLLLLSINRYLLEYNSFNNLLTTTLWIFMAIIIFILALRQPSKPARNKIFAYLLLLCFAIAFWSVALLAPMGLARLVDLNAPHTWLGVNIPSAWFNNINCIVMIIFGPLLGILFYWLRHRSIRVDISMQFTIGLLFTGIALILLSVGIRATTPDNNISGIWIIICYVLQAIGTLLIQPIGLAMVGQLAPIGLQGILMGYWMMVLGIASVIATEIAKWIQHSSALLTPSIIDPHYSRAFNLIGWSVISTAMVLILFSPLLLKLIRYRSLDPTLNKH